MAKPYDFDRFLIQNPREEGDRRHLSPERVAQNLLDLRATFEDPQSLNFVLAKSESHFLLATWNIQHFGSKKRYDESLWYIAEILSRLDLIAIQKVKQLIFNQQVNDKPITSCRKLSLFMTPCPPNRHTNKKITQCLDYATHYTK